MTADDEAQAVYRVAVRRAFVGGDPSSLPLYFDAGVVDRYRGVAGFQVIRTDTVGRIRKQGAWTLDVGISPDEEIVHACIGDLLRLPEDERQHWSSFSVTLPSSKMMLQMRLAPGSCFDDGDLRPWD